MKIQRFECTLSHALDSASERKEFIKASLVGAAGLDYAKAKDYPPCYLTAQKAQYPRPVSRFTLITVRKSVYRRVLAPRLPPRKNRKAA